MYRGYLIDLDGTLYNGNQEIPQAAPFISSLLAKNIPFRLVTNNATRSSEQIVSHLAKNFNIHVTTQHIYTSTQALIHYLRGNHLGDSIFVIGDNALCSQIESAGFILTEDTHADLLVQGLKQDVNYEDLSKGVQILLKGGSFLVTNTDRLIPTSEGFQPSSGAITAFLQFASQVEPLVFGKPNSPIMEGALASMGVAKNEVVMIGDNYETDIMAGINAGIDTILVLTGVTKVDEVPRLPIQPNYIIDNLSEWQEV